MTEEKQDDVIRESGRVPRERAAEEFFEEQQDQAAEHRAGRQAAEVTECARVESNHRPTA